MTSVADQRFANLSEAKRELMLRRARGGSRRAPGQTVAARADKTEAPLTSSQLGIWTAHNLYPDQPVWNLVDAFWLSGVLNVDRFKDALHRCIERHDALRMTIVQEMVPYARFAPRIELPFVHVDVSANWPEDVRAGAVRMSQDEVASCFDITRPPLLRVALLSLSAEEHLLVFKLHHLAGDGWSFGVIVGEVQEIYTALSEGRSPQLPELSIQYGDYAAAEEIRTSSSEFLQSATKMADRLRDAPRISSLPTDFPRRPVFDVAGACHRFSVGSHLATGIGGLARRYGATKFAVMLTAFVAALSRYANQDDIVVGVPVANRRSAELEPLVGMFVNTAVQRVVLAQGATFVEALQAVSAGILASLQDQHVPFEEVLRRLELPRDASFHPLFQVMFVYQNWPFPDLALPGLSIRRANVHPGASKYDLTLVIEERDGVLEGYVEYATALFVRESIEDFASGFCQALAEFIEDPTRRVKELLAPSTETRREILASWDAAESQPLHLLNDLVETHARACPEKPALLYHDQSLAYLALCASVSKAADDFRRAGWVAGTRVGLLMGRGFDVVVAILACLKCGICYVPLDLRYPVDRIRAILADAGTSKAILSKDAISLADAIVPEGLTIEIVENGDLGAGYVPAPDEIAYLIYTSGSTGTPKAVAATHENLSIAIASALEVPGIGPDDRVLALSTVAFDAHVLDLLAPLAAGATVRIADDRDAADPHKLASFVVADRLTLMQATPSTWRLLRSADWKGAADLRGIVGAEPVDQSLARWMRAVLKEAWHLYGVTECTVWQAGALLSAADVDQGRPPLSRALPGHRLLVLDDLHNVVAPGLVGELYIGGKGVARGYFGNTALSDERFVHDPYSKNPAARMYRTGDLARLRLDGKLELLGRADHQVKVRGCRVELGEIEAALLSLDGIEEVVVVTDRRGLIAYFAARPGLDVGRRELRHALGRTLPEFMIPDLFIRCESLPRNPNGKIDRNRLGNAGIALSDGARLLPGDADETKVARIWAEILGTQDFGIDDGFFDVGGTSLLAFGLLKKLQAEGYGDIDLIDVFEFPTVRNMARLVARANTGPPLDELSEVTERARARRRRSIARRVENETLL
ncbi:amino acid adenylation domain-containing protein [Bradyrhizobium sp. SZCCHNR2035]|uniref:non-ribosomal peptide synthetase n=1 Tax=Bradyrhizobium sp. SZCCHNR2035 TaxID=3057386 RepID=UPI002916A6A2|nr:amino acid adenylation domain-containing protein [Bradyrhizobium sp. SZCCHNR2035]